MVPQNSRDPSSLATRPALTGAKRTIQHPTAVANKWSISLVGTIYPEHQISRALPSNCNNCPAEGKRQSTCCGQACGSSTTALEHHGPRSYQDCTYSRLSQHQNDSYHHELSKHPHHHNHHDDLHYLAARFPHPHLLHPSLRRLYADMSPHQLPPPPMLHQARPLPDPSTGTPFSNFALPAAGTPSPHPSWAPSLRPPPPLQP